MAPSSLINESAIRHRNPHSHQPSTALNIGSDDIDKNGDDGSKFLFHRHYRRRIIISSSNTKYMIVLGGALAVFSLCIMGLWSTSFDTSSSQSNKLHFDSSSAASSRKHTQLHGLPHKRPTSIESNKHHGDNNVVQMQGWKYEKLRQRRHGHEKTEVAAVSSRTNKNRNRFHELPSIRKKKKKRIFKGIIDDDEVQVDNNNLPPPLPNGGKPRTIYVLLEPIYPQKLQQQQSYNYDDHGANNDEKEKDYDTEQNKYRHFNPFHLTKVRRISSSELPYDTMEYYYNISPSLFSSESSSSRLVSPYPDDDYYFENIEKIKFSSKKYRYLMRDSADENCQFKYDWQLGAFPNCNTVHEFELGQLSRMLGRMARRRLRLREGDGNDLVKYLSHGYWRDVWVLSHRNAPDNNLVKGEETKEEEELTVLKTLRYEHDFSDRNYDRHRKDALASERLSGSPHVVDIYAFCQNTAVFEYGEEGDIEGKLFPYNEEDGKYYVADLSSWEKLDLAYQVACGVADIHDVEEDGIASIAHTDITPSQFIYIDGKWKINDFNRCRFMREYKVNRTVCGFEVKSNPGKFRSPEEYAYEVETEKIDVYSMGNVLYSIISGMMPFEGLKSEKAMKAVMEGKRPKIPRDVEESDDIAIQAILSATKACWIHDPKDRPPATEIRDLLKSVMDRINKENTTINSS